MAGGGGQTGVREGDDGRGGMVRDVTAVCKRLGMLVQRI